MSDHGIGMADAMLGLDGFKVLEVTEGDGEPTVRAENVVDRVKCDRCGQRAESQDRVDRVFRDLPCSDVRFGWNLGSVRGG